MPHVLYFSTRCQFCVKFLELIKESGKEQLFKKINIDFHDELPEYITNVPTIIIDGKTKVEGRKVFEWLNTLSEESTLQPSNIQSDPYSFLDGNQQIHTDFTMIDVENTFIKPNINMDSSKSDLSANMESLIQQRNANMPQPIKRV